MKKTVLLPCVVLLALTALGGILLGQIAEPPANVSVIRLIPIPGWTTAAGAFDLGSFNPVNRLMYFGDGTNHAVTTVGTTTNTLVSVLPIGCTTASCPSGVQVAPDQQKLLASSRQASTPRPITRTRPTSRRPRFRGPRRRPTAVRGELLTACHSPES